MFLNRHISLSHASKKRARGPTRMAHLILIRNQNKRLNVELNESNAPLVEEGRQLSSYIRCVASHYVPNDIGDWRAISKELKNKILDDILVNNSE